MTPNEERISALFKELVPGCGKADSLAGEILRATSRIGYRRYNDGDKIGIGYGKETTNAPARFLQEKTTATISAIIDKMWGNCKDAEYDELLESLNKAVADHIENNPELRKEPTEDMWDWTDTDEDRDDQEDDDDDDWEEEY